MSYLLRNAGKVGLAVLFVVFAVARAAVAERAEGYVAAPLIVFNDNGGWSWFEDERVIVDRDHGKILVSSVANREGAGGAKRHGDVDVASFDLASKKAARFVLKRALEADDHNSAALLVLPDGRYLASYSKHSSDNRLRYRVSSKPGDAAAWEPEQVFQTAAGTTYSNLAYLADAGTVFNFHRDRGRGFDPNYLVWRFGKEPGFSYGGRLLTGPEGNEGNADRPYLKYVSNGVDRIDFITSDGHPRNERDNKVYHGYIKHGGDGRLTVHRADGTALGELSNTERSPYRTSDFTLLPAKLANSAKTQITRAWPTDIEIDSTGQPCAIFTGRVNDRDSDHRFFYGRLIGSEWQVRELAKAGTGLYARENDYTGLAAIDPNDSRRVFISTNIDPRTNRKLPHHEIFEGVSSGDTFKFRWTPITFNSQEDNLRPVAARIDEGQLALVWMRGKYRTYVDYDTRIVGVVLPR